MHHMVTMYTRPRGRQTDEHHSNSAVIRSNECTACKEPIHTDVVYVLPIQLLGCHNYNKHLSLVIATFYNI